MAEILEQAQKLYNEGRWEESDRLIEEAIPALKNQEDFVEALRLRGWNRYYLGIKGPVAHKEENLLISKIAFLKALGRTTDSKKRISILNGLPLALWNLEEGWDALATSISALAQFTKEPSIWNTAAILLRWAERAEDSIPVCERVYRTALARRDYRTAAHGKENKGDALKQYGRYKEAEVEYKRAEELYKKFEEKTGESAKFHIEGVEKKLLAL